MSININPAASHPLTNKKIYNLITENISKNSKVLDFGSGQGYMAQKIVQY